MEDREDLIKEFRDSWGYAKNEDRQNLLHDARSVLLSVCK
jgi:hypothetical protein